MTRIISSPSAVISLNQGASEKGNVWNVLLDGANAPIPILLQRLGYQIPIVLGTLRAYVHQNKSKKLLLLERHPLWSDEHPEYILAKDEALKQFPSYDVRAMNPFIALRRPTDYVT